MDDDGAPDLLVAGHEYEDQPTVIYWGDRSGTYDASRKTTLPAVPGRGVVVDIDAEDLDGEGDRDIVLSRTSSEPFYAGYYVQVVAGHGSRRFADETARRITDGDRPTARWLEWIRIEDVNRDGFPDLWVDEATRHRRPGAGRRRRPSRRRDEGSRRSWVVLLTGSRHARLAAEA